MTLRELMERASNGYGEGHELLELIDAEGRPLKRMPKNGDTLAQFIVQEIADTFDADTFDDADQVGEAVRVMQISVRDIESVIRGLSS